MMGFLYLIWFPHYTMRIYIKTLLNFINTYSLIEHFNKEIVTLNYLFPFTTYSFPSSWTIFPWDSTRSLWVACSFSSMPSCLAIILCTTETTILGTETLLGSQSQQTRYTPKVALTLIFVSLLFLSFINSRLRALILFWWTSSENYNKHKNWEIFSAKSYV